MKARSLLVPILGAALVFIGVAPSSAATMSHSGTQHFLIAQSGVDGPEIVVARGPISAVGKDIEASASKDRFVFSMGDLTVKHTAQTDHQTYNRKTCISRFSETGTFVVLSGSGSYRDASGWGTYVLHGFAIGCSKNRPPAVFEITIRAVGTVSY